MSVIDNSSCNNADNIDVHRQPTADTHHRKQYSDEKHKMKRKIAINTDNICFFFCLLSRRSMCMIDAHFHSTRRFRIQNYRKIDANNKDTSKREKLTGF